MDESLKLFRDVLGFTVARDITIPDGPGGDFFDQQTLDDIFHVKGSKSRMVIAVSDEGAMLELQQPEVPKVQAVPKEHLRYGYVGISEIAFSVKNIDAWFEKIKAAGYEPQTNYIWGVSATKAKSFLFYDPDGSMLQFYETVG
jgi:catechol 2,3-dioxygenase-like lactoylglutathione lyase family enzyme